MKLSFPKKANFQPISTLLILKYRPFFWEPVTEWLNDHCEKGSTLKLKDYKKWQAEKNECLLFKQAIKALLKTSQDPFPKLQKVEYFPDKPNLYEFVKGRWKAYFLFEKNPNELTGFLITSDKISPEDTLVLVARALGRF